MTPPPRTFDAERDLGYRNLIVGGFEQVWDGSCAGAGNNHIARSIVTGIELGDFDPAETLVVVMWSGYDRDDFLVSPEAVNRSQPDHYCYTNNVLLGMTGGLLGDGNLIINIENLKKIKNQPSRALENYIIMQSLAGYLDAHGFRYVFTEFSTPGRMKDTNFDPVLHLPTKLQQPFIELVRDLTPNLGDWALPELNQNKESDGYHPDADHHLSWCRQVLLPYILPST
jgi:hypothetical protein